MTQACSSHMGLLDFEIICSGAVSGNSWCSPAGTVARCSQEIVLGLAERVICWPYLCSLYEVYRSIAGRGGLVSELLFHIWTPQARFIQSVIIYSRQGLLHVLHARLSDDACIACEQYEARRISQALLVRL